MARIDPASLDQLLHPTIDPQAKRDVIATGLPASPGAASGEIVFSSDEAAKLQADGRKVILVRVETSPEDIHGMHAAEGILTTRGGMTSHAAVVARGMGKPCVSGCGHRSASTTAAARMTRRRRHLQDAATSSPSTARIGQVLAGRMPMMRAGTVGRVRHADGLGRQGAQAQGARQCRHAGRRARPPCKFGAEGIGLCRTEHMFFEETRIRAVREMILADDEQARRAALAKLLPMQRADFVELFEIMKGLPVTIRLLDPPLHEFLPHTEAEIAEVAARHGRRSAQARRPRPRTRTSSTRCSASAAAASRSPIRRSPRCRRAPSSRPRSRPASAPAKPVGPEVMVPLIATKAEFDLVKARIDAMAAGGDEGDRRASSTTRSAP